MMTMTTISAITERRWGVSAQLPAVARFRADGWSYDEPTSRTCRSIDCGGRVHALRKPYTTSRGVAQRYVALVCERCGRVHLLKDFGVASYASLLAAGEEPHTPAGTARAHPGQTERAGSATIIDFWRAIELFSAQSIPKVDHRKHRVDVIPARALPWEAGSTLPSPPSGKVWRHTLFGGVHRLDEVHALLVERLHEDAQEVDERTPRGESAIMTFQVDHDGRFIEDSLVLSSAAWAIGRTARGPWIGWLDGFEEAESALAKEVGAVLAAADRRAAGQGGDGEQQSGSPVEHQVLSGMSQAARTVVGDDIDPSRWRVESVAVPPRTKPRTDFLNSFVAEDLARVSAAVRADGVPRTLARYLSESDGTGRVDVRTVEHAAEVDARLEPRWVPAGRWPTSTARPLATSQQLGVAEALNGLGRDAGILGVNGPPGTGKTTMLRDLVAGVVTERADVLAGFSDPADAFEARTVGWRTASNTVEFRPLRTEVTGFEIVVASANNGAVENVTRELPAADQIDHPWSGADHFGEEATRLLGAPAWGLVAAVLGNQQNRFDFVARLWETTKDPSTGERCPGLRERFVPGAPQATGANWRDAVDRYRRARAAEGTFRRSQQAASDALRSLPDLEERLRTAAHECAAARRALDEARRVSAAAAQALDESRQRADRAAGRVRDHARDRPGVLETLLSLGRTLRSWRGRHDALCVRREEVDRLFDCADAANRDSEAALMAAERCLEVLSERESHCAAEVRAASERVAAAEASGARVPDRSSPPDDADELVAPWLHPAWNAARTECFLAALELHRVFLLAGGRRTAELLRAAIAAVRGAVPKGADPEALHAAWQGLFLLVPVVSTTFSSVGRMFRGLGAETLGWLLIDEAGQAAPQSAVGAIWRARRVVAVGDPLQLEPVVTVLNSTQGRLRATHGVSDRWRPFESVQTLVDRQTQLGTMMRGGDAGCTWVGAPLRVHRRCDDPMFTVINDAVYDGLMVRGNAGRTDPLEALGVPASRWIDVAADRAEGHWIPAEGEALIRLLGLLVEAYGIDPERILVLSPFRAVADRLRRVVLPGVAHGTVHVSQGREADIVVLVLGGHPGKPGAKEWVTSRPNLFNVAVSRAKHRLFVIGDRSTWGRLRYFSDFASASRAATDEIL